MSLKRILLVFAHPDDETFTSGATIAKYAADAEISLLCATRGQAGKRGEPPICTPEELPMVREQELRDAAAILGIKNVQLLDYEDKFLNQVPLPVLVSQIQDAIRRCQPQVVITFAPHGISGHPDHHAISLATDQAVATMESGHSVLKLYHVTLPSDAPFVNRSVFTDPPESITTVINEPTVVPIVAKALLAHRTQHMSVERVFPGISSGDYSHVRHTNHYILVWHNLPDYQVADKETDLFAGISPSPSSFPAHDTQ